MKTFKFNSVSVRANNQAEAAEKLRSLIGLAASFDLKTLQALQQKGPTIFNGPKGPMVRKYLGM